MPKKRSRPERPLADLTTAELREMIEVIRKELANRTTPSARQLREAIDPGFEIPRATNCCVYVIELDEAVRNDDSFAAANPDADPDLPCLYVGSTDKTAEERFAQHRTGPKSSRIVKKYGVRVRPEFTIALRTLPRDMAESEEQRIAGLLRADGYGVWQY